MVFKEIPVQIEKSNNWENLDNRNSITLLEKITQKILQVEQDMKDLPDMVDYLTDLELAQLNPEDEHDAEILYNQELLRLRGCYSDFEEAKKKLEDFVTLNKEKSGSYDGEGGFLKHHEILATKSKARQVYSKEVALIAVNNVLDNEYDKIYKRLEFIERELLKFNVEQYIGIVELPQEQFVDLVEEWKELLREKNLLLPQLDQIGIEVLKENLHEQPHYPDVIVNDDSEELTDLFSAGRIKRITEKQGEKAYKISFSGKLKSLREQVATFIYLEEFDDMTASLIHELIHRKQKQSSNYYRSIASLEAQAHSIDRQYEGRETLRDKWELIEDSEGVDVQETDRVLDEILNSLELMALGLTFNELMSSYNQDEKLTSLKNQLGLGNVRVEARENFTGQYQEQNELFDSIREMFDLQIRLDHKYSLLLLLNLAHQKNFSQDLERLSFEYNKKRLIEPIYYQDGRVIDTHRAINSYRFFLCTSDIDDLPEKSGLLLDYYLPSEFDEEIVQLKFGYLQYNNQEKTSHLEFINLNNDDEKKEFFSQLQQVAPQIVLESKLYLVRNYSLVLENLNNIPEYDRFLTTLISQEEALQIIDKIFKPNVRKKMEIVLQKYDSDISDDTYVKDFLDTLGEGRGYMNAYKTYCSLFGLDK